jgi:alcohol dehydrogenase (NADP+)
MGKNQWDKPMYPLCPGHEIVAEVAQIGSEVKDFKIGEKVGFGVVRKSCNNCRYCKKGKETLCINVEREDKATYGRFWGGWATQIQQPAEFFFKMPQNIDLKKAGPLFCAACTVYGPIKSFIKQGDKCGVVGIGGLGHLAIKLLKNMGLTVTALTHSDDKKPQIYELGCQEVLMLSDKDKLKQNEQKFYFIINTIPTADYFNDTMKLLSPEGRYVMVGIPPFSQELKLDFKTWIFNDIILIGSLNGSRKLTEEVMKYSVDNNYYPEIEMFSFDDLPNALEKWKNVR